MDEAAGQAGPGTDPREGKARHVILSGVPTREAIEEGPPRAVKRMRLLSRCAKRRRFHTGEVEVPGRHLPGTVIRRDAYGSEEERCCADSD